MRIILNKVSKKFGGQVVLRDISAELEAPFGYAVLGGNGSGKSTLLRLICGLLTPSEGSISWEKDGKKIAPEQVAKSFGIAAPYAGIMEELTLREQLEFHAMFKSFLPGLSIAELIARSGLEFAADRPIRNFSSGMRQKLKILLAVMSDNPVVLLDEPHSNLDAPAMEWYAELLEEFRQERLFVIFSNHRETEYFFCKHFIEIGRPMQPFF